MDDTQLDQLLAGDLARLAPLPKRVVRLFISSTFTDMTLERNSLMERVYPRLKKFCREKYGLDFQVVDMRWGVRDEATDDHQTVDLCSREIANCQRLSLGPNFVAFIGDKYGFRPLPNRIDSAEFRSLRRALLELDVNSDFLDTWYREDLNAVPGEHLLQPISSILKNFTNKSEPELQLVDQRIWQAIQERLHELLMLGSSRLVSQGRMSAHDQLMRYSISVTEREVIEGCLAVGEAKLRCLVYMRSIVDLRQHVADCLEQVNSPAGELSQSQLDTLAADGASNGRPSSPANGGDGLAGGPGECRRRRRSSALRKASLKIGDDSIQLTTSRAQTAGERRLERNRRLLARYIDLLVKDDHWRVDAGAQAALAELKASKLRRKLNPSGRNLNIFEVHWNEQDGLSQKSEEHKQYLQELNEHFYSNLTRMIRNAVRNEQSHVKTSGLVGEVLQHSHYARQVGDSLQGRQAELDHLRDYLLAGSGDDGDAGGGDGLARRPTGLPMFVYGVGGSGKTAVLARAASLARQWILGSRRSTRRRGAGAASPAASQHSVEPAGNQQEAPATRRSTRDQTGEAHSPMEADWSWTPCVIMRFCCTTPSSSSMSGVLTSVCRQLQYNFYQFGPLNGLLSDQQQVDDAAKQHQQLPYRPIPEDFVRLVFTFRRLLDNCGHPLHSGRQFVIFLDSIDRLSSTLSDATNLELRYSWLTSLTALPPNVRLIVSCSSDVNDPSSTSNLDYLHLKRHFVHAYYQREVRCPGQPAPSTNEKRDSADSSVEPVEHCTADPTGKGDSRLARHHHHHPNSWLLHVRPLGAQLAAEILARWLADSGRNLSQQQWAIVERSFARCSRPMFVKLALGEVIHWKSYSMQGDTKGLTFGSSWLAGDSAQLDTGESDGANSTGDAGDPVAALRRLVRARELEGEERASDKWTLVSLEQQWLNYLDYVQKIEEQASRRAAQSRQRRDTTADQTIVIQIGGHKGGAATGTSEGPGGRSGLAASQPAGGGLGPAPSSAILCHLSDTIEAAISQLFARIELQHGYLLTKHSLSYITAARNGIGENELEDILSLDDVVLDDVFQYHLPPVRRIPPLLWTRLRNDLPNFLTERDSDGIVVAWHHSHFQAVTRGRYLADARQLAYIHSTMADYFLGRWADKPKPFRCTRQQIQMAAEQLESAIQSSIRDSASPQQQHQRQPRGSLGGTSGSASGPRAGGTSFSVRHRLRSSDQHNARFQWMQAKADRRVPSQPLYYLTDGSASAAAQASLDSSPGRSSTGRPASGELTASEGGPQPAPTRRYNLRKLTELPHHLLGSGRFIELAQLVLFNYSWIHATLSSLGLQTLFADFDEASRRLESALAELAAASEPDTAAAEGDKPAGDHLGPRPGQSSDDRQQVADCGQLESIIRQLSVLGSTLRLSSSIIHSDSQMLAPQLIGRLVSIAGQQAAPKGDNPAATAAAAAKPQGNEYLAQLIGQCDLDGSSDCALLPIGQCLQPADGLQSSSLEGHPFGVMSMAITADQRNLLAVSSKFIMWNMATGELVRDIDPKLEGSIMLRVAMGRNSELAVAYTSDNLVLVLDIITQQVSRCRPQGSEQILGLRMLASGSRGRRFAVWTRRGWSVLLAEDGDEQQQHQPAAASWTSSGQDGHRIAVRPEYCIDLLDQLALVDSELLEVWIDPSGGGAGHATGRCPPVDLAVVLLRNKTSDMLELLTIELILDWPASKFASLFLWKSRLQPLTCVALSDDLMQVVFSDPLGDVYLSRRRQLSWSRPKRLRSAVGLQRPLDLKDQEGVCSGEIDLNSNHLGLAPISIELECCQEGTTGSSDEVELQLDDSSLEELAKFEARLDGHSDEIEAPSVFGRRLANCEPSSKLASSRRQSRTRPIEFVKLYLRDRIVVLKLKERQQQQGPLEGACSCLWLPKSLCNVRLAPNRGQLTSVILQAHLLVASMGRRLLVFSLESDQLLKCFDGHSSRITELRPIQATTRGPATGCGRSDDSGGGSGSSRKPMSVVTCSIDRTVRVWNLHNIRNRTKAIAQSSNPIDVLKVANQSSPFAVSLGRNELALWDWQTLDIIQRLTGDELESRGREQRQQEADLQLAAGTSGGDDGGGGRITCCKLSHNGRLLAVASSRAISLFAIDSKPQGRQPTGHPQPLDGSPDDASNQATLRPIFRHPLASASRGGGAGGGGGHSVARLRFVAKDSRLIVISRRLGVVSASSSANRSSGAGVADDASEGSLGGSSDLAAANSTGCRLVTDCYSIPDGRRLWSMEHQTPAVQSGGGNSDAGSNPTGTRGYLAATATSDRQRSRLCRQADQGTRIRLPTISLDQQFVVCVESNNDVDQDGTAPLMLQLYSVRDGQLARSIDLSKLLVIDQQQRPSASVGMPRQQPLLLGAPSQAAVDASSATRGSQQQATKPASSRLAGIASFAIGGHQFSRLKAVSYFERQSIVALINDSTGTGFLVDIGSRQLVACLSDWNGRMTSDGRYGLTRLVKSSGPLPQGIPVRDGSMANRRPPVPAGDPRAAAVGPSFGTTGMQLVEMRHGQPVRSLLTLGQLRQLLARQQQQHRGDKGARGPVSAFGGDENVCDFTRPNNDYVYYYDTRLCRLLLIRVRDGQVLANYKSSVAVNRIKCSPDGFALILGLADGSLVSLAIVDAQASETVHKLAQYPTRRRLARP